MRLTSRLRWCLAALAAVFITIGPASTVHADGPPGVTVAAADDFTVDSMTIDIDPTTLLIITAIVIPFAVGLLTKLGASARVKATVNLVCTAVAAFLANAVTEGGHALFSWAQLRDWALALVISVGTYHGLLKPFDVPSKLGANVGFGRT
jgi:hypothetical protein